MASKSEIRGQVREGLAKLKEGSACAKHGDRQRGERLLAEGFALLHRVGHAGEEFSSVRESAQDRRERVRESMPLTGPDGNLNPDRTKPIGSSLLDRMGIDGD